MSRLDGVLELLADGAWHGIDEVQQRLGLNEFTVQEVMAFLCEYAFVQVDAERGLVKINPDFKKLLVESVT